MLTCRNCGSGAERTFVDLGVQPLANSYLRAHELDEPEVHYPLRPVICEQCRLVQLPVYAGPAAIFTDYAFFSGQSRSWVEHCDEFATQATALFPMERVLEIASNDGTLLEAFRGRGCGVLGVEPARNVAWVAQTAGIPTIVEFFGSALARRLRDGGYQPDLIVANNVLAHVPDLGDFLRGVELLMSDDTVATFEFPHLAKLIENDGWDAMYHEHLSYFGFITAQRVMTSRGLRVFDVERLDVHGGSIRLYVCKHSSARWQTGAAPAQLSRWEQEHGYWNLEALAGYAACPPRAKRETLRVLSGFNSIVGYGAPAKGSTWLNYLGLGPEMIEYVVDSTPAKQGKFLPGSRIPVLPPEVLQERRPETILILPWNWRETIIEKIQRDCDWDPTVICRPGVPAPVEAAA